MKAFLALSAAALALAACNNGGGEPANGTAANTTEGGVTGGNGAPAPDGGVTGSNGPAAALGPGGEESIPCPFEKNNREWAAWVNKMPGPGAVPTLIVTGEVETGAGYSGRLTRGALDKMKPPNQHFELTMVEQTGAKAGWNPVRAEVRPANPTGYASVVINCHGDVLKVIEPVGDAG